MSGQLALGSHFTKLALLSITAFSLAACASTGFPSTDRLTAGIFLEEATEEESGEIAGGNAPNRSVTVEGLALLKEFEGEVRCRRARDRHCAYDDASRYCTIGHGHLIAKEPCSAIADRLDDLGFAGGISDARATELLVSDLAAAQRAVERRISSSVLGGVGVTDYQYDALTSFVFNVGGHNFSGSTLLKRLNARQGLGDNREVATQFLRWTRSGGVFLRGLENRRRREALHFFKGFPLANELASEFSQEQAALLGDEEFLIDIRAGEQ